MQSTCFYILGDHGVLALLLAYKGAGVACGIALGTRYAIKELLLCAFKPASNKHDGSDAIAKPAKSSTEFSMLIKQLPQGAVSPSKDSMKVGMPILQGKRVHIGFEHLHCEQVLL